MKKHTSQSELKSFNRCKRQWFLGYVRRLRLKQMAPNALTLGSLVHIGLEHMDEDWRAHMDAEVEHKREELDEITHPDLLKQHELATIMVEGWIEWIAETGLNAGVEVIGKEWEMAVDMSSYVIMGKADEVVRRENGDVAIRDWKTAADFRIFNLADIDIQFRTYIMMLNIIEPNLQATQGEWVVGRKVKRTKTAKPPFYDNHITTYNEHTIAATQRMWDSVMATMLHLEGVWAAGTPGQYHMDRLFPPAPNYDCQMCHYRQVCPMFDDGSRAEDYLEEWYEVSDPFERYSNIEITGRKT